MCKLTVIDAKVIPGKEVTLQHLLLVRDMRTDVPPKSKHKFTPHLKVWKLKGPHKLLFPGLQLTCECICSVADAATEYICNNIKTGLSRQLSCMAQLNPIIDTLKPGSGVSTWERLTRGKLSWAFKAWKTGKGTRTS